MKKIEALTATLMMDAMAYAYVSAIRPYGSISNEELDTTIRGLFAAYCRGEGLEADTTNIGSLVDLDSPAEDIKEDEYLDNDEYLEDYDDSEVLEEEEEIGENDDTEEEEIDYDENDEEPDFDWNDFFECLNKALRTRR